jgi:hypothetical protein
MLSSFTREREKVSQQLEQDASRMKHHTTIAALEEL